MMAPAPLLCRHTYRRATDGDMAEGRVEAHGHIRTTHLARGTVLLVLLVLVLVLVIVVGGAGARRPTLPTG